MVFLIFTWFKCLIGLKIKTQFTRRVLSKREKSMFSLEKAHNLRTGKSMPSFENKSTIYVRDFNQKEKKLRSLLRKKE